MVNLDDFFSLFLCLCFGRERIVGASCKLKGIVLLWARGCYASNKYVSSLVLNLSSAGELGAFADWETGLSRTCLFLNFL